MKVKAIIILIITFLPGILFAQNDNTLIKKWSLSDCINYALEQNIQVRQSILSNMASEVNKDQALVLPVLKSSVCAQLKFCRTEAFSEGIFCASA